MIVELILQFIFLLWLMEPLAASPSMAKPGCQDVCGNVTIPYPFGYGKGDCYHEKWFEITCNESVKPPKPFLSRFNLEVLSISLDDQSVTVNVPIAPTCRGSSSWTSANLSESPFRFSPSNSFIVMGCGNALLTNQSGAILGGCTSTCNKNTTTKGCYGINCCATSIPSDVAIYSITTTDTTTGECMSSFLSYSVQSSIPGNFSNSSTPVLLDWMITSLDNLPAGGGSPNQGCYQKTYSITSYGLLFVNGITHYDCRCYFPYEAGNPYISNGCEVVPACAGCIGSCTANYSTYTSNGRYAQYYCYKEKKWSKAVIIGVSTSGGLMFLLTGGFLLYKLIIKIRNIRLRDKFFKRNGGMLLQQQMASSEGVVDKVFTSEELQKATDNFNKNRILGQGGQGTVYKGMLTDGRIVAIKKSKLVDENQLEQFINEVVILSQINHRNVVKLLGCCLETEVPLLVYEFISNGTLFELIHDQNEEFSLSWERRLQIAIEVAGAVAYLHSASSMPIYHRDIKSTNILLDDKYRAKVSDFGTSRSISIEQTHLTTLVHGTFGYLDPEYFQSSQFTEKSDVYSFGVVLAELLTGQKPISSIRSQEERSLATHFILSLEENHLFDIIDARVMKESKKEEIIAVANLAKRCLNLSGKKRPIMKEVTMELEGIRMPHIPLIAQQNVEQGESIVKSHLPLIAQQNFQKGEYIIELTGPLDGAFTSTSSSLGFTGASPSDSHPLLSK